MTLIRNKNEFGILFVTLPDKCFSPKFVVEGGVSLPPLGIMSMSSTLKQYGYSKIKLMDFRVNVYSEKKFEQIVREFNPQVIGISVFTENHHFAVSMTKFLNKSFPDAEIVLGSTHATFNKDQLLKESKARFVCMGESENSLLELVEQLFEKNTRFEEINGLAWKSVNNEIVVNKESENIKTLDALPLADRHLIKELNYMNKNTMITTRGCPGNCKFCSSKAFWGSSIKVKSAKAMYEEIVWLLDEHKTNNIEKEFYLEFLDDTFTIYPSRLNELCDLMIKNSLNIRWFCLSRLDSLTKPLMEKMYKAGLKIMQIGVECADQDTIEEIGKNINLDKLEQVLADAKEIGIRIQLGFMIGFPNDTKELIVSRMEYAKYLWKEYKLVKVSLTYNTPYPGTFYFDNSEKTGLKINATDWRQFSIYNPIVSNKHIKEKDLAAVYHDFNLFAIKMRG